MLPIANGCFIAQMTLRVYFGIVMKIIVKNDTFGALSDSRLKRVYPKYFPNVDFWDCATPMWPFWTIFGLVSSVYTDIGNRREVYVCYFGIWLTPLAGKRVMFSLQAMTCLSKCF